MFHAPTTEAKQQNDPSRNQSMAERSQELSPRVPVNLGHVSSGAAGNGMPPGASLDRSQQLARLHSVYGNQAVLRMLSHSTPAIQTKLAVNQPGDPFEQEADRVADQVMRMTAAPTVQRTCTSCKDEDKLQRKCAECEEEEKKTELQRKENTAGPQFAPPSVHDVLNSPGQPLDPATRAFMEPRFGYDFSSVRVHTDGKAAESARALNALAYTVGKNVVFGTGQFAPASDTGRRVLSHELVHVVQQGSPPETLWMPGQFAASDGSQTTVPGVARLSQRNLLQRACETFTYPGRTLGTSMVPGQPCTDDQGVTGISGTPILEHFSRSSHSLTPFHSGQISALQSSLHPTDTVAIHGYASCDGTPEFNLGLSCDRAEEVKRALATGTTPFTGSVTTLAHGETDEFGPSFDANRRVIIVTSAPPQPCPPCPEDPRTPGCPLCDVQPEPQVFFCNKPIPLSSVHRQGHAFFRVGGSGPGNPTFELEHDEKGDHCPCGIQGIPQRDYPEDRDATDATCIPAPGITASCLAANWNTYPVGMYCALGPNSNTYARFLAEACGGVGLRPPGNVLGFDDSPPVAGTANNTSNAQFFWICDNIDCNDASCVPPRPSRADFVQCVKDQGLCGIPGGIPTTEQIQQWNEECHRRTGYDGEDATTEECGP